MNESDDPTEKQKRFLGRWGVDISGLNRFVCSTLIQYILRGNGSGPRTVGGRGRYVGNVFKKWLGRRVVVTIDGGSETVLGSVSCLMARPKEEIQKDTERFGAKFVKPFSAAVKPDNGGKPQFVPLQHLRFEKP